MAGSLVWYERRGFRGSTVERSLQELKSGELLDPERTRRPGGGRKPATERDPSLLRDLESLVEARGVGRPDSPLSRQRHPPMLERDGPSRLRRR